MLSRKSLIEAYTEGRTKPAEVRLAIHPEFWGEELEFYDKKFELVRKNRKDTRREYRGRLEDPTGNKKPLDFHIVIEKRELGYLEDLDKKDAHFLMYSGHSAVGGNGSDAVRSAPEMVGEHPKTIFAANCRGKDNYAETANAVPDAHIIMTVQSTYGDSGQARVEAFFDMLVRDETYAWMRKQTEIAYWDEPADNYFYPDEWRKFLFADADDDGLVDFSKLGIDTFYDVELAYSGGKFMRALNFANCELYYHHSVEHDNGLRSHYGKRYADSLIAAGQIRDPKPGELVRVTEVEARGPRGGKKQRYVVRFDPGACRRLDDDVLAGHVTAHTIMNLAKIRDGELKPEEAARAFIMGAQAVH